MLPSQRTSWQRASVGAIIAIIAVGCMRCQPDAALDSEPEAPGASSGDAAIAIKFDKHTQEVLDHAFDVCSKESSRWRQLTKSRMPVWSGAAGVGQSPTLESACRLYCIPPALIEVGQTQLDRSKLQWEKLHVAKRHSVLDFLLVLSNVDDMWGRWYAARYLHLDVRALSRAMAPVLKETGSGNECEIAVFSVGENKALAVGERFAVLLPAAGKPDVWAIGSWEVPGDSMPHFIDGVICWSYSPAEKEAYVLLRLKPLFTTQPPTVLLRMDRPKGRWAPVDVPAATCVTHARFSKDGKRLAIGTSTGEVAIRASGTEWASERVFKNEAVARVVWVGNDLVAVSVHGAVAKYDSKEWKPLLSARNASVLDCLLEENGRLRILFDSGSVVAIDSNRKTTVVDWRTALEGNIQVRSHLARLFRADGATFVQAGAVWVQIDGRPKHPLVNESRVSVGEEPLQVVGQLSESRVLFFSESIPSILPYIIVVDFAKRSVEVWKPWMEGMKRVMQLHGAKLEFDVKDR